MIVHECAQNSADWWRLRLGIPTASASDKLITSKTLKPSAQATGLMDRLLSEWATGVPSDDYQSRWMERGHELEPEAWAWYEMRYDVDVVRGGFCTLDDGSFGCSPDGRIYDGNTLIGGIELKCPSPPVHISYLRDPQSLLAAYRHQVAGTLMVTGCDWWDLMSYHPLIAPVTLRIQRADVADYIAALEPAVAAFAEQMGAEKARLIEAGVKPRQYTHNEEAA